MSNIMLVSAPFTDGAILGGGSWQPSLPLANLVDKSLSKVARTTDLDPASTQFTAVLPLPEMFRVVCVGPTNLSVDHGYRIRLYSDAAMTDEVYDSGLVNPFYGPGDDELDLEWEDPDFWLGVAGPPNDPERGLWIVHVLPETIEASALLVEMFDVSGNPVGYLDIGRLFPGKVWQPSLNYTYGGSLAFKENTIRSTSLSGGENTLRRVNPRLFGIGFDYLPESELFGAGYDFQQAVGYDGEVFVIPDPDDPTPTMQRRAYLATATRMDALTQAVFVHGGTGFEFKEILK